MIRHLYYNISIKYWINFGQRNFRISFCKVKLCPKSILYFCPFTNLTIAQLDIPAHVTPGMDSWYHCRCDTRNRCVIPTTIPTAGVCLCYHLQQVRFYATNFPTWTNTPMSHTLHGYITMQWVFSIYVSDVKVNVCHDSYICCWRRDLLYQQLLSFLWRLFLFLVYIIGRWLYLSFHIINYRYVSFLFWLTCLLFCPI